MSKSVTKEEESSSLSSSWLEDSVVSATPTPQFEPVSSDSPPPSPRSLSSSQSNSVEEEGAVDEYEQFREKFHCRHHRNEVLAVEAVCDHLPNSWRVPENAFRKPAKLGFTVGSEHKTLKCKTWEEFVDLQLEPKAMPYKRLAVEVFENTVKMSAQEMVDAVGKYTLGEGDSGVRRSKVMLRTAHVPISLFKEGHVVRHSASDCRTSNLMVTNVVVLRFHDRSGLKMLKPVRVGHDVVINLDILAIKTLQELKFADDYFTGKPMAILQGSFVMDVGSVPFFLHFQYSGMKIARWFELHFVPLMARENRRLSAVYNVIFDADGHLLKPKKAEVVGTTSLGVEETSFSLNMLPSDIKAYLLSMLDFPDLLAASRTCKAMHQVLLARRFSILSSDWIAKTGRFVGVLVPQKWQVLAVWAPDSGNDAIGWPRHCPILTGETKWAMLFHQYFFPIAMRFKVAGGKRTQRIDVCVTVADMRSLDNGTTVSVVARDAEWFALPQTASPLSCLFTIELPRTFVGAITEVQIKGMSCDMLWTTPWWLFLMSDAIHNVRESWWRDVLNDLKPPRQKLISVAAEDLMVMTTILMDPNMSEGWKKMVLQGIFLGLMGSPTVSAGGAVRWVEAVSHNTALTPFVRDLAWIMACLTKNTGGNGLDSSVLDFLNRHPHVHLSCWQMRPMLDRIGSIIELMFRMVLNGDPDCATKNLLSYVQWESLENVLENVARKYCGMRDKGLLQWIDNNIQDKPCIANFPRGWDYVKSVVENAKPKGSAQLQAAVLMNICTIKVTGLNNVIQTWYRCNTCWPDENKGVCISCAVSCHKTHVLSSELSTEFYCDCSSRDGLHSCKCQDGDVPAV